MSIDETDQQLIGQGIDMIDTPALVVDLDKLDANLSRMADFFSDRHACLRPHFKSHKCVELARRQLAAGSACGITCAKLSEAEKVVAGGIDDVLVANQIVGRCKTHRLAKLNRNATVRCAVDSAENIRELGEAAQDVGTTIPVLVEVDIGMNRCGVLPGRPTLDLAQYIADVPGIRFDGLQGYEGHLVYMEDLQQRAEQTREAMAVLVENRRMLEQSGLSVTIVSAGGTGTYDVTGNIEGIDEVQCGSYALMDWYYAKTRPEFHQARWILATVISVRGASAVVDVGLKGAGTDFGPLIIDGHPDAKARYTAEEHVPFDNLNAQIGDRLRLVPSHGCTTNNLYRKMWITRDDMIVDVWAIEGSGCLA